MSYRVGFGIDFHRLQEGRNLWIGGVKIDHNKGALGHSDADVLLHAICDALLGSLAFGDIGMHFPDTDPVYKGIESKILLERSFAMVKEKNYTVVNIDCSICLEMPKIQKHTLEMRKQISKILEISTDDISIKATTTEKMGFIGREEGVAAYAVVLLRRE